MLCVVKYGFGCSFVVCLLCGARVWLCGVCRLCFVVVCGLLFDVRWFDVCCVLFGVCCLMIVGCCFLLVGLLFAFVVACCFLVCWLLIVN